MIRLEPLNGHHYRNGFDCGVYALNVWLKKTTLGHQVKGISHVFVAVPANTEGLQSKVRSNYDMEENGILGFYVLTSAFVLTEDLPTKQAKRYPRQIPVTRLGPLATRSDIQG